jgi:hypothetical protein
MNFLAKVEDKILWFINAENVDEALGFLKKNRDNVTFLENVKGNVIDIVKNHTDMGTFEEICMVRLKTGDIFFTSDTNKLTVIEERFFEKEKNFIDVGNMNWISEFFGTDEFFNNFKIERK